jgi:hypothetical protein
MDDVFELARRVIGGDLTPHEAKSAPNAGKQARSMRRSG